MLLLSAFIASFLIWPSCSEVLQRSVNFNCPDEGYFPIPGECSQYLYVCIQGQAYLSMCPGNNIFDPVTLSCTPPDQVSCLQTTRVSTSSSAPESTSVSTPGRTWTPSASTGTSSESATSTSTEELVTSPPFQCPSDGNFPVTADQCNQVYFMCIDGFAYEMICSGTNQFDPISLRCTASCLDTSTTETTDSVPFTCVNDGLFPLPGGQCTGDYYFCSNGVAYIQSCPGSNIFDPISLRCASADTVSCSGGTANPPAEASTMAPFTCPADGLYPIVGPCSADFYFCVNGVASIMTCSGNSVFDPISLQCVHPGTVSCEGSPTWAVSDSTDLVTSSTSPFTCPADGYFADPAQCTDRYYVCVDGNAYQQECPGDSLFDPITLSCASPDTVSCLVSTESSDPVTTESTPTSPPFICATDGSFAAPGQCVADFFICIDGISYPQTCPAGSLFDPSLLICKTAQSVSCLASTTDQVSDSTDPASTTIPFICPSDGSFAIGGQCVADYYICFDGISYRQTCPGGSLFDPLALQCRLPQSVSCLTTQRPITETTPDMEVSTTEATTTPTTSTTSTTPTTTTAYTTSTPSTTTSTTTTTPTPSTTSTTTTTPTTTSTPSTTSTTPTTTSRVTTPFVCPYGNGWFPNPDDCSTYFTCSNNLPYLMQCPPTLVFNPTTSTCDYRSNVAGC